MRGSLTACHRSRLRAHGRLHGDNREPAFKERDHGRGGASGAIHAVGTKARLSQQAGLSATGMVGQRPVLLGCLQPSPRRVVSPGIGVSPRMSAASWLKSVTKGHCSSSTGA